VRAELAGGAIAPEAATAATDLIAAVRDIPAGKIADGVADAVPGLPDDVAADLAATAACLERLAAARHLTWEFDPTLVRGMGYYTGQVFELVTPGFGGSVAGGGRYDKLIGRWLGRDVAACGFSIGFERITDLIATRPPRNAVAVLAEPDVSPADALAVARGLRAEGQVTEVIRRSGKLAAQLTRLEGAGFSAYLHLRADDVTTVQPRTLRPLGRAATA
jgi:histidyl-tRNA synthetase